jgi:hypothetical protein
MIRYVAYAANASFAKGGAAKGGAAKGDTTYYTMIQYYIYDVNVVMMVGL